MASERDSDSAGVHMAGKPSVMGSRLSTSVRKPLSPLVDSGAEDLGGCHENVAPHREVELVVRGFVWAIADQVRLKQNDLSASVGQHCAASTDRGADRERTGGKKGPVGTRVPWRQGSTGVLPTVRLIGVRRSAASGHSVRFFRRMRIRGDSAA